MNTSAEKVNIDSTRAIQNRREHMTVASKSATAEGVSNKEPEQQQAPESHVPPRDHVALKPFFDQGNACLFRNDALLAMRCIRDESIDCIVTSPPYYGQRDYGVAGQIGLEPHPQQYIDRLVTTFREARRILKPGGSLWVNIGDTYWSGKGAPTGPDAIQKHRRFERPQDRVGERPWCTPKQLLLIPHRFAIAMQEQEWIVRNDNVWYKPSPTPDPVEDRCAHSHEYVFHFVKQRKYYFDAAAVALPSSGKRATKPPQSVWTVATTPSRKQHMAAFPDQLVWLPILATCPEKGVLLDPFCGSGTAIAATLLLGSYRSAIGIDLSLTALQEARDLISAQSTNR